MQVLDATIAAIAQDIAHLHKLVDNIALLDMLCSLATVARGSSQPYTCPHCMESGDFACTAVLQSLPVGSASLAKSQALAPGP